MVAHALPLLSHIFMDKYDNLICNPQMSWNKNIHSYFRYVDICIIWIDTERKLHKFVTAINQLHKNINFKLEPRNKKLNFLILSITIVNNKLKFGIYRKESYTDVIIPCDSS